MKNARLYFPNACVEDIEYHADRKLDKGTIPEFATCKYILEKRNIILLGITDSGKTFLACAFGAAAC